MIGAPRPTFDRGLIEQYRSVLGDGGARQLVELFVTSLAARSAELGAAVLAGDLAEVRRVGHTIKGMAAAVGATALSACGLELQRARAEEVAAAHQRFLAEATSAVEGVHDAWQLPPPRAPRGFDRDRARSLR